MNQSSSLNLSDCDMASIHLHLELRRITKVKWVLWQTLLGNSSVLRPWPAGSEAIKSKINMALVSLIFSHYLTPMFLLAKAQPFLARCSCYLASSFRSRRRDMYYHYVNTRDCKEDTSTTREINKGNVILNGQSISPTPWGTTANWLMWSMLSS